MLNVEVGCPAMGLGGDLLSIDLGSLFHGAAAWKFHVKRPNFFSWKDSVLWSVMGWSWGLGCGTLSWLLNLGTLPSSFMSEGDLVHPPTAVEPLDSRVLAGQGGDQTCGAAELT